MSKKIMIMGLTLLMLMSGLIGCKKEEEKQIPVKGGVVRNNEEDIAPDSGKEDPEDVKIPEDDYQANPLKTENVKGLNEKVRAKMIDNELYITVQSVEFSKEFKGKEIGAYEEMMLNAHQVERDSAGNIQKDYTYIWLELELEAIEDVSGWYLGQFPIYSLDEFQRIHMEGITDCYLDGLSFTPDKKVPGELEIDLKKGEKKTVLIGYLAVDNEIEGKTLGYYISEDVTPQYPGDESYFVKLN